MHGSVATRHGNVLKMRKAGKAVEPANQHFSAPDAAVGAIAGTIERQPDYRALQSMFCHASSNVRVVMLHANRGQAALASPLLRPVSGQISRMQIVRHRLR